MSYVPATSDRDMWAMLGGLLAAVFGVVWFDLRRARRKEMASRAALGAPSPTGESGHEESQGRDCTEAGQDPEAPR